jgi:hypothetical protein
MKMHFHGSKGIRLKRPRCHISQPEQLEMSEPTHLSAAVTCYSHHSSFIMHNTAHSEQFTVDTSALAIHFVNKQCDSKSFIKTNSKAS